MSDLSGAIEDLSISVDGMTRESILTNQLLLALVIHQVGGEREAVLKVLPDEVRSRVWQASQQQRRVEEK